MATWDELNKGANGQTKTANSWDALNASAKQAVVPLAKPVVVRPTYQTTANPILQQFPSKSKVVAPISFDVVKQPILPKPVMSTTSGTTRQLVQPTPYLAPVPPPIAPTQQQITDKGRAQSFSQGTPDPSIVKAPFANIPVLGTASKALFGFGEKGNANLYPKDTMAGSLERKGAVGFFLEGFKNLNNPTRERIGEQIYSDYETRVKKGEDPETALKVATQNLVNKKTPNMMGGKRAIDEIQNPNIDLTTEQSLSLLPANLGRKVMAVLDFPAVGATVKPIQKAGVTILDEAKDEIIKRFASQKPLARLRGGGILGSLPDGVKDDYLDFLTKTDNPTQADINKGLELLRLDGRKVDDIAKNLAPVTDLPPKLSIELGGLFKVSKINTFGCFDNLINIISHLQNCL